MHQNLEQLSGAGAVGAMLTVFVDRLAGFGLTEVEFAMVAAGLAAIVGFAVGRLPRRDPDGQANSVG